VLRGVLGFWRGGITVLGELRSVRLPLWAAALAGVLCALVPVGPAAAVGLVQEVGASDRLGREKSGTPDAKTPHDAPPKDIVADIVTFYRQQGEDAPRPFVPLRPSTVDDRRQTEVVRLYSAARALEERRAWADAAALLQQALKLDPDSIAVARRLTRIYIGALGRPDLAVQYGKRVLAIEPGDCDTLIQLVEYYKRTDAPAAEVLLSEVLSNPKLPEHAPGRLLANFELGTLYSGRLHEAGKAADCFAKVLDGLDDKSANRLSPAHQFRILGSDPATAYLKFGLIFLAANRDLLAVKALERGLVYDEDNSQISLVLAETLLKLKKGEQALALVEHHIERQTPFVEAYELLAKVLKKLNREKEITPRLEAAARRDSKNVPLQYVLADRYRETGENDKAEALYKELHTLRPTPQTYGALAHSLLKRKKSADLLRVFAEAWARTDCQEAIRPQLQIAAADDATAEAVLDAGLQMSAAHPSLPKSGYDILALIANNPAPSSQNRVRRLEKLLRLQRLHAEHEPSTIASSEIADTLRRQGKYAEAAAVVEALIAKDRNMRSVQILVTLANLHRRAGHNEAVRATLREAMRLDPSDGEAQTFLANLLSEMGQLDDAARLLRDASKRDPANPRYELILGAILTRYGRNDEAIKVFESMLKRFGDNEEVVKDVHERLSVVFVNQGDYAKGEAELLLLLERYPDDPGSNNDLGYLYAEQGKNLEKAELMIRKALQENPNNEAYLDSLGWVLFKRGRAKEALDPLKRAVERVKETAEQLGINPDTTILEHLGDVHFELKQLGQARDAWREAERCAEQAVPPDKRLPEIRKKLDSLKQLGPISQPDSSPTP
jgi:tetratricopeptide (TPR) repeat protein